MGNGSNDDLRARVERLEAELAALRAARPRSDSELVAPATPEAPGPVSRRQLLRLGGAAGVAAAGAALATARPAAAAPSADGDVKLGGSETDNTSPVTTTHIATAGSSGAALHAHNHNDNTTIFDATAITGSVDGDSFSAAIRATAQRGTGLEATSNEGVAVVANGQRAALLLAPKGGVPPVGGAHVAGEISVLSGGGVWTCTAAGVPGDWREFVLAGRSHNAGSASTSVTSNASAGVLVAVQNSVDAGAGGAIRATSLASPAVEATSNTGVAVVANGQRAALLLLPKSAVPPVGGPHSAGEISVSSAGGVWTCTATGAPGNWHEFVLAGKSHNAGSGATSITSAAFGGTLAATQTSAEEGAGGAISGVTTSSNAGPGVTGIHQAAFGTGVRGLAPNGLGVVATGDRASILLTPRATVGPPVEHELSAGGLAIDSAGTLFQCKPAGNWVRVGFNPIPNPFRLVDTRVGQGGGAMSAGERRAFTIAPSGTPPNHVPGFGAVNAVMLNVTAVSGSAESYFTVLPHDAPAIPGGGDATYSNVNWKAGQLQANQATVRVVNSQVDVFNRSGTVHLIIDVIGFFS